MSIKRIFWGLLSLLFLGVLPVSGQDKKALEASKKQIEQEIANTSKLLDQTRANKRNSLAELELLNRTIRKRTQLIDGLHKEVVWTENRIDKLSADVVRHGRDIESLKGEYSQMLRASYLHRNQYSKLMFVLASSDFNQAIRRLQYIRQYGEHQRLTVDQIKAKQEALKNKMDELSVQKDQKYQLVSKQEQEKGKLQQEKTTKDRLVGQLKKKEGQLAEQLKQKQKKRNQLNTQIQKIIQEEIRQSNVEAQKRAQASGKKASTSTTTYALTPEEKALSSGFENNRGRLPWPTEKGSISSYFGTHAHPVVKSVTVTNNGVDIVTERGADARAVFSGEVSNVGSVYGQKFVMVRHGAYTTVYSNLNQTYVSKGDKVKTKQALGKIAGSGEDDRTELQFQIWKGISKMDPEPWLAR